ncbi:MAG: YfcE family phosphodiesterase [Oscillospiraceae bacterium]|nr:YfcE family phosphodiesterase [Oscillospiraceae bacterium]
MLKAAVFSDTHGNTAPMLGAARAAGADVLIHLGDHDRDAQALRDAFPDTPVYSVCGNCDVMPLAPEKLVVPLGAVKALLVHGHRYGVSTAQADWLVFAAREEEAQIAMFGHTHSAFYEQIGGVTLLNPGTAGCGRVLSWALVTVFDNGAIACEIREM